MGKKKSNAQIRRMVQRAEARGEKYTLSAVATGGEVDDNNNNNSDKKEHKHPYKDSAIKLKREFDSIGTNEELRAKERRSAKRKAEAIAAEEAGCSVNELMDWYNEHEEQIAQWLVEVKENERKEHNRKRTKKQGEEKEDEEGDRGDRHSSNRHSTAPYIVFVGQLSYRTTAEALRCHFVEELRKDHNHISEKSFTVRLLTDAKTKKSKGMAFVEVCDDNPEVLYGCLKLHHTQLDGRRINVERSAGGKRNSESRKRKIQQLRTEQEQRLHAVVDKIISEHQSNGEIQPNELDDAVIAVCKRHTASVVEAALTKYIESNGREMDNPSAYLNHLIGKMTKEGIDSVVGDNNNETSERHHRPGKKQQKRD